MKKLRYNTWTDILIVFLLLGGLFFLLRPFAPKAVEGAFYAVKFVGDEGTYYQLFGDGFSCLPIEDLPLDVMCGSSFEGRQLDLRLRYQDQSRRFLSSCWLTYGGSDVSCEPSFGYESELPFVVVRDDLGISAERFGELRGERPLLNWPEKIWTDGLLIAAVLLGGVIVVWRWLRFDDRKEEQPVGFAVLSMLLTGLVAFLVALFGVNMLVSLLFNGPNAPYWLSSVGAVIGVVLVFLWRWQIHQGWRPAFGRVVYSLAGGTAVLSLTYYFGLLGLLILGFVD